MKLYEMLKQARSGLRSFGRPYVIAEAGVNHGGDINIARRLIDEAKEGGADAVKFQTYKAASLASRDSPAYWDLSQEPTQSQYDLFRKYDKFWKSEFEMLAKHCQKAGIEFMSTPFDMESAQFLSDLMPVFKISSSDLNNKPFIEFLCGFGKPIILSTGASYMWEVERATGWIEAYGLPVALLHCILNYPTDDRNANLAMIPKLIDRFPGRWIGYSDHTLPKNMKIMEVATILGARILEKHFTHDKTLVGNDHYHAMDKVDLKRFHRRMENLITLLGSAVRQPFPSEEISRRNARRSLVAARFIPAGRPIVAEDITWKRPGTGIGPDHLDEVIGRSLSRDCREDEILKWNMLE